ncbi:MAG TPA: ABC transporter permease [Steroidobacteraceae bacterium]|nr:ABC transporter permease [Steroidobacteraceae bacterium]
MSLDLKTPLIIEPQRPIGHYWRDLLQYRELFYFLAWRDVLVRYKQTAIGVAWVALRPLLTMAVISFVFGRLARLPSGGVPYPLLVFAAVLPWQFFATALSESGNSLVSNATLISKVYFPRLIVPATGIVVALVDLAVSGAIFLALLAWYGVWPDLRILALPAFLLLALLVAMGAGLWLAALNARYRDVRYVVPFLVQFGLYISPVGFSSSVVPSQWRLLYSANPMVGVIDGFRWSLLGQDVAFYWPGLVLSIVFAVALFGFGLGYFRRVERSFADVI